MDNNGFDFLKELQSFAEELKNRYNKDIPDDPLIKETCDKYHAYESAYENSYGKFKSEVIKNAYRTEYASGAVGLYLSYYSPSYQDLFIGGVKRGRIVKKPKKVEAEYIFDKDGKIICYKEYLRNKVTREEYFDYKPDKIISVRYDVSFPDDIYIETIAEYIYDGGRIIHFEYALFKRFQAGCSDAISYMSEDDEYNGDRLKSTVMTTIESAVNIIHREKYTFYNDDKGKLKYDYEQLIK